MTLIDNLKHKVEEAKAKVKDKLHNSHETRHHLLRGNDTAFCSDGSKHDLHRFQSFAPERTGNQAKWFVDGCSYMYAVSVALEAAQEEIWILDWWLSPELYLRRPPAKNEQFRLDRMLFQAANRGVKVNVIVYKEVSQALTLNSSHTKHWLEDNDKSGNISVFRHPDHIPDRKAYLGSAWDNLKQDFLSPSKLWSLPGDALHGLYGMSEGSILYWAHHEKLVLIDRKFAFMGGLDLCFGRWDTNQHSIADVHPGDLNRIVFPGQDYNNARVMDFHDVPKWDSNKLERTKNSRMGWSDIAIALTGPIVQDLGCHFTQRWNWIFRDKYNHKDARYKAIVFTPTHDGILHVTTADDSSSSDDESETRGATHAAREQHHSLHQLKEKVKDKVEDGKARMHLERLNIHSSSRAHGQPCNLKGLHVQMLRSASKWSHNCPTEHSIANAYIGTIRESQHFIYIENQFFITATTDTGPKAVVQNQIGAALVERILRAAEKKEDFHVIVVMPAVPAFAGDLQADESLGTRAIMEFQYDSINRGGQSIMQTVAAAGVDPMDYIRFYNLRNYDRINNSAGKRRVEEQAGVAYDEAAKDFNRHYGAENVKAHESISENGTLAKDIYQNAAVQHGDDTTNEGRWDSVAECYMKSDFGLLDVPFEGTPQEELDSFVSEELYVHSKVLIADDRVVICGSANINDRSQLGTHDSEIAVLISSDSEEDCVASSMAGRPWQATRFAASLRRQIFRKHLGLLEPQDLSRPDQNWMPLPDANVYDWGSSEDKAVEDPLSVEFKKLWNNTAETNTEAFGKVFHPVPSDRVRSWAEYKDYYARFFPKEEATSKGKDPDKPSQHQWGHVVAEEFAPGEEGVREVKEELAKIRGNLVEMPLLFLREEDIAVEGMTLNAWTREVYT